MAETALPLPDDRKADRVLVRCVYRIATGKWAPGARLPSVREAERLFGVDRKSVLEAYRRLEEAGLARRVDRSGTFVTSGREHGRLSRHRPVLERLFEDTRAAIVRAGGLSTVGAFRYMAELAAIRAAERPECAFVECTVTQARGHAREVARRLAVPCLPLVIGEPVPEHVRAVLVSGFHYGEVRALASDVLRVASVPIEVAPDLAQRLPAGIERGVVLEADEDEAHDVLADVRALGLPLELECRAVSDAATAVDAVLADPHAVALLAPRVFGALGDRERERVVEVSFRVREDAWPDVADAIGLPLSDLG